MNETFVHNQRKLKISAILYIGIFLTKMDIYLLLKEV